MKEKKNKKKEKKKHTHRRKIGTKYINKLIRKANGFENTPFVQSGTRAIVLQRGGQ